MKKILLITTMAAVLTGFTALGQGNFIFSAPGSFVWNQATHTRGGPFNEAFLWNQTGSGTPLVGISGIASNAAPVPNGNKWSQIMSDPNYKLAMDNGSGLVAVGTTTPAGGITYNAASPFLVTGSSSLGGNTTVFIIAWDNTYATPALAAAALANVGFSPTFVYTYASGSGSPSFGLGAQSINEGTAAQFGTQVVPEPATFALAGLGAAAMLIFRRRK